jgi:uncharacterized protein YhbP (UPF0306 family)
MLSLDTPTWRIAYRADFRDGVLLYSPIDKDAVAKSRLHTVPLQEWINLNKPTLVLDGDRIITGDDRLHEPLIDLPPFDPNHLVALDWQRTDISVESQKAERRPDSIQAKMSAYFQEATKFDALLNDDGSGEAADLVGLRVVATELHITLVHCKYSSKPMVGPRVADLYELCGQAIRGAKWRQQGAQPLLRNLDRRTRLYNARTDGGTPYEVGGICDLHNMIEIAPQLVPVFRTVLVQPGLSAKAVKDDYLRCSQGRNPMSGPLPREPSRFTPQPEHRCVPLPGHSTRGGPTIAVITTAGCGVRRRPSMTSPSTAKSNVTCLAGHQATWPWFADWPAPAEKLTRFVFRPKSRHYRTSTSRSTAMIPPVSLWTAVSSVEPDSQHSGTPGEATWILRAKDCHVAQCLDTLRGYLTRSFEGARMTTEDSLAGRTLRLLNNARYLNLATVSEDGLPWVAVLEYAWLLDPLRFVFGSATGSRHSRHVAKLPQVSGSLFLAGNGEGLEVSAVDGAQFTGSCAEVAADDLDHFYSIFYETVFPDPQQRAEWMLPQSLLRAPAEHRLYLIEVERWWLIDTRTWAEDRIDRRVEMPLTDLKADS